MTFQMAFALLCIKHDCGAGDAVEATLDLIWHQRDSELGREMDQLTQSYTGQQMDGRLAARIHDMDDELYHTER
jgi:hypothetical protein